MESSPENKMKKLRIDGGHDEIDVVRERLMLDLKFEAGKIKDAILKEKENGGSGDGWEGSSTSGEKVWNFRTRRGMLERVERDCCRLMSIILYRKKKAFIPTTSFQSLQQTSPRPQLPHLLSRH